MPKIFSTKIFSKKNSPKIFPKKYFCQIFFKKGGGEAPLLPAGPRLISSDSEISAQFLQISAKAACLPLAKSVKIWAKNNRSNIANLHGGTKKTFVESSHIAIRFDIYQIVPGLPTIQCDKDVNAKYFYQDTEKIQNEAFTQLL